MQLIYRFSHCKQDKQGYGRLEIDILFATKNKSRGNWEAVSSDYVTIEYQSNIDTTYNKDLLDFYGARIHAAMTSDNINILKKIENKYKKINNHGIFWSSLPGQVITTLEAMKAKHVNYVSPYFWEDVKSNDAIILRDELVKRAEPKIYSAHVS